VGQFGEVGLGGGEHGLHRVNLPRGAGRGHGADHAGLGDARGAFPGLEFEHGAGQGLWLAGLSAQHPVPAEGAHEPQRGIRVLPGDRPAQCGVQVVLLGGQLTEPTALPGAAQPRVGRLGQHLFEEVLALHYAIPLERIEEVRIRRHPQRLLTVVKPRLERGNGAPMLVVAQAPQGDHQHKGDDRHQDQERIRKAVAHFR